MHSLIVTRPHSGRNSLRDKLLAKGEFLASSRSVVTTCPSAGNLRCGASRRCLPRHGVGLGALLADVRLDRAQLHGPADHHAARAPDQQILLYSELRRVWMDSCGVLDDICVFPGAGRLSGRPVGPALDVRGGRRLVVARGRRHGRCAQPWLAVRLPGLARGWRVIQLAVRAASHRACASAQRSQPGQRHLQFRRRRGCCAHADPGDVPESETRLARNFCCDWLAGIYLGRCLDRNGSRTAERNARGAIASHPRSIFEARRKFAAVAHRRDLCLPWLRSPR